MRVKVKFEVEWKDKGASFDDIKQVLRKSLANYENVKVKLIEEETQITKVERVNHCFKVGDKVVITDEGKYLLPQDVAWGFYAGRIKYLRVRSLGAGWVNLGNPDSNKSDISISDSFIENYKELLTITI